MKQLLRKSFIFFVLVAIIFCSCSNKLNRGRAEKIIKQFYEYPNVEAVAIYSRLDWSISGTYHDQYSKLQNIGLITMQEYIQWGTNYSIRLTDKGNNYKIDGSGDEYIVVSNKREFKEVTGITFTDENNAKVEFAVTRENITPFGELVGYKEDDIENYSVEMKKYDDGWRITNNKEKILKPRDFPNIFTTTSQAKVVDKHENVNTASIKLNFFKDYNGVLGDAMGKYSYSKDLLRKQQYIFITGCSDPGNGIYDAVIKVNDKFIRLNPIPQTAKNENMWPQNFEGQGYKVNLKLRNGLEEGDLEIIYGNSKEAFKIYGDYRDEWGED